MTLRADPELRDAYAKVKADKSRQRKERKAAAVEFIKARVAAPMKGQRAPRVRNTAYLQFVRRHACCVCGSQRAVEAAHVRSGYPEAGWTATGMQQKPDDARCVPLCATDHREGPDAQHRSNERAWWEARGIYPPTLCASLMAAFLAGGEPIQLPIRTKEQS